MKFISMRVAVALAAALTLASCGGGKATFTIAGTVSGLEYDKLVLTSNGMDVAIQPAAKAGDPVSYKFPHQIEYGDEYAVSVKQQPLHQECTIPDAYDNDTAGRFAQINVPVFCNVASHNLIVNITGLDKDGLVLINGSTGGTYAVPTGTAKFTLGVPVTFGVTYGVTVLASPAGLACTVQNGAGTMGDNDVDNIAVTCVPT
jgi:hypothetical protein